MIDIALALGVVIALALAAYAVFEVRRLMKPKPFTVELRSEYVPMAAGRRASGF